MDKETISPEQQIENLIAVLVRYADEKKFRDQIEVIRSTAHQLQDMYVKHRRGELEPIELDEEVPF